MLVLSRLLNERIYIGESISIQVVEIERGRVKLGIEAPRDIPIYRQELLPGIKSVVPEKREDQ